MNSNPPSTPADHEHQTGGGSGEVSRYATSYRLRLSHPLWQRDTFTKWQASPDFTTALKRAEELGVTATVESHNEDNSAERRP